MDKEKRNPALKEANSNDYSPKVQEEFYTADKGTALDFEDDLESADSLDSSAESQAQRKARVSKVFFLLFITMYVARTDQGIVPALNTTLKSEFDFTNIQIGQLGSVVYMGAVLGSALSMPLFDKIPARFVIFVSMIMQCGALTLFTVSTTFFWQAVARFASGACQVVLAIFLPVWVDSFAPRDKKTTWLTYNIAASPAGLLTGYGMSAAVVLYDITWYWAFYIHIIMLLPIAQVYLFVKPSSLDVGKRLEKAAQASGQAREIEQREDAPRSASDVIEEMDTVPEQQLTRYERFNIEAMAQAEVLTANYNFKQRVVYILSQMDYVLLLLSITCLFVVITGIQFWSTDYFVSVLGVQQSMAFRLFFVVGAIGPITGVLSAGIVFDRFGGYNGPKAIPIISGLGFVALVAAISSTLLTDPYHVAACMTIQLFCGGFILPAATGLMLNQVPSTMRTVSNSIANLCFNLFGYVPAPYLYGQVYQRYGGGKSHAGIIAIQFFVFLSYSLLTILSIRKKLQYLKRVKAENAYESGRTGSCDEDTLQDQVVQGMFTVCSSSPTDNFASEQVELGSINSSRTSPRHER